MFITKGGRQIYFFYFLADMLPLKKLDFFRQYVKNIQHALNNVFSLKPFFCNKNLCFCTQDYHRNKGCKNFNHF